MSSNNLALIDRLRISTNALLYESTTLLVMDFISALRNLLM